MGRAACHLFFQLRTVELSNNSVPLRLSRICQRRDCTMGGKWRTMAPFKGHLSRFHRRPHEKSNFVFLVLMDYCGGTNTPSTCLAMLRDSTTPLTTEPQAELWCHISAEYLPTTAKSAKWRSLCSSRSAPMRSNSAKRHYDYSTRNGKGNIDDPDL
jgi:hypothetical protein